MFMRFFSKKKKKKKKKMKKSVTMGENTNSDILGFWG